MMENFLSTMNRILAPIKREMRTLIVRGIVRLVTEDAKIQTFQIESFEDDLRDDVEHFHTYGLKSHAPIGSEVVMVNVGGNNEHSVVIGVENREVLAILPKLDEGDSIFYNKEGSIVHVKGKTIEIKSEEEIKFETTKNIELKLDKIKVENSSNELIAVLIEWLDQAIINKNITGIGPQPLFPADVVKMQAIKAKLETFKS